MGEPIIRSLLDIDLYKLTMSQFAWKMHPRAYVQFAFFKRTRAVNLPEAIPVGMLIEELEHARKLRFSGEELYYLRSLTFPSGKRMFENGFIEFLAGTRLQEIMVEPDGNSFRIEVESWWPEVTLWETIVLSIVNELYNRRQLGTRGFGRRAPWRSGYPQLESKIRRLAESNLRDSLAPQCLVEFGTRRRFSREWQRVVVATMNSRLPELFAGTSNVRLAMDHELRPVGTYAHEVDMVYSGLSGDSDEDIRESHRRVLEDWWGMYGEPLSIALTDTYGTRSFFDGLTTEQARDWRGFRHDSGPWRRFGEQVLEFYRRHGIDPATKTIVWSDGLTPETILDIDRTFGRLIKCVYGWGTNLTNDFGPDARAKYGIHPLSIVMKVTETDGYPTVKLSDNPAKAIGPRATIDQFKRVFGYNDADYQYEECTY